MNSQLLNRPGYLFAVILGFAISTAPVCAGAQPTVQTPVATADARANPEGESSQQASLGYAAQPAYSDTNMVATANEHATRAALRMLANGGSAVDAAIAAQMVLTLVEPQSSGIGGGAFMLHYGAPEKKVSVFDGRETAPAAAYPTQFLKPDGTRRHFFDAVDSGLSVGVPGLVRMLGSAHRQHGQLPWPVLFEPAIELASNGFAVSPRLHQSITRRIKRISAQPAAAAYFLDAAGNPLPVGSRLRNPALAGVLSELATQGPDAFYAGKNAQAIVDAVTGHSRRPGVMTLKDLAGYQAVQREPLCHPYRRLRVCGMPPPSSGGLTVLQSLSLIEHLGIDQLPVDSIDRVHRMVEAYRLAYADRARYIADPDFVIVPVDGLLDAAYTASRAVRVSPRRSMGNPEPGTPAGAPLAGRDNSRDLPGTTHLSIVDNDGNAVSMTSSIETAFGSMLLVRGYLLNNQLTDFSFRPTDSEGRPVANRVEPNKRPRSSMAPTVVLDEKDRLEAVLGSPGGSSIIQYVTNTLVNMAGDGLDVQQAISASHFGAKTSATTTLERGTRVARLQPALEAMGHKVRVRALTSGLHAVIFNGVRPEGVPGAFARGVRRSMWAGGADPRREGVARGH